MKFKDEPAKGVQEEFSRVSEGWHIFEFLEGMKKQTDKETGELSKTPKGDQKWQFPTKVVDEDDPDNEIPYMIFLNEDEFGEKWLARFLKAANITKFAAFEKAYPGDHSFFEEAIIQKIMASKNQLTGERLKLKIELRDNPKNPKQPFRNVVAWAAMNEKVDELDGELFAGKGGGKKEAAKKAPVADDEGF
jgi:hypothetical protein